MANKTSSISSETRKSPQTRKFQPESFSTKQALCTKYRDGLQSLENQGICRTVRAIHVQFVQDVDSGICRKHPNGPEKPSRPSLLGFATQIAHHSSQVSVGSIITVAAEQGPPR